MTSLRIICYMCFVIFSALTISPRYFLSLPVRVNCVHMPIQASAQVMSTTMKAVDIKDGKGPASSLFINSDIPKPQPKPTECLIRVRAFGLNRADTMQREGKYVC